MPTEEEPLIHSNSIMQRQMLLNIEADANWLQSDDTGPSGCSATGDEDEVNIYQSSTRSHQQLSTSFLQHAQFISIFISLLLSPVAIALVSTWVGVLGGVSWAEGDAKHVFNWHPVMMVTAYAMMTVGVLVFRISGTSSYRSPIQLPSSSSSSFTHQSVSRPLNPRKRRIVKLTHSLIWTLNVIFGVMGMIAVFKSHNDPISGYIANLYSLHSWIGISVLSLYALQFLVAISAFSGLCSRHRVLPTLMEVHKYTGAYIHILATSAILMGIQEKEGFVSCSYSVDSADLTPAFNYGKIPYPCKVSHWLGVVILLMGLCTNFGLARFPTDL